MRSRPEAEFLKALAVGNPYCLDRNLIQQLDPVRLRAVARRHQIDALCYWRWTQLRPSAPHSSLFSACDDLISSFRDSYCHFLARNDSIKSDLSLLADSMASHSVPFLVLKGPWLTFAAYPDPGTRSMDDLDLCIHEDDYSAAIQALLEAGYLPAHTLPKNGPAALAHAHYRQQLRFVRAASRPVELHFRLLNMGPIREVEHWVWNSTRPLSVGRCTLRVPGPEAMLLHLLIHCNQHGFSILRLLHDIHFAIARDNTILSWISLIERVRSLRCSTSVFYSLLLTQELTPCKIPCTVFQMLHPGSARRLLFELVWRLGAVRQLDARLRKRCLEAPIYYLLEMGRFRDKVGYSSLLLANLLRELYHRLVPRRTFV